MTIEERLRQALGELTFQNCGLMCALDEAKLRIKELEDKQATASASPEAEQK